ncbi:MAG: AAA family ATPase [Limnobacter sp.]|nr:AAA family ATPase [Limnobacter sp.]
MAVVSPKGGVGKTSVSANFATGLAARGYRTCVVDFDFGLRNLDFSLGCEMLVEHDLQEVLNRSCSLPKALVRVPQCPNLHLLPGYTGSDFAPPPEAVSRLVSELRMSGYQFIVIDSASGLGEPLAHAIRHVDDVMVVLNPEVPALLKAQHLSNFVLEHNEIGQSEEQPVRMMFMLNRYRPRWVAEGLQLSLADVAGSFEWPLLGVIPEDATEKEAVKQSKPVIFFTEADIAQAYWDAVDRYTGQDKPLRFIEAKQPASLWQRLLGKKPVKVA